MARSTEKNLIPAEVIERRIYLLRGHKVMLDNDLAELYSVTIFNLNKAVNTVFPTYGEIVLIK